MPRETFNPLVAKLRTFVDLSANDERELNELCSMPRSVEAGEIIIRRTDDPDRVTLCLSGYLARFKSLPDGRTQIVGYMVPGDVSDLHAFRPRSLDDDVRAIDAGQVVDLDRRDLARLYEKPTIAEGLYFSSQIDEATAREWILNVGRRSPQARVAHLLCELFLRLRMAGLAEGETCPCPLTPSDVAETTGLSAVQVTRVLKELEDRGTIAWASSILSIPDAVTLRRLAGFSARYLQLDDDWGRKPLGQQGGAESRPDI